MTDIKSLYNEGEKLRDEGKHAEAVEKFREILKADPNHILALMALGVACGKINEHAEAVECSEKACELEPNEPFNYTALSVTYQRAFEATRDPIFIEKAEEAGAKAKMIRAGM